MTSYDISVALKKALPKSVFAFARKIWNLRQVIFRPVLYLASDIKYLPRFFRMNKNSKRSAQLYALNSTTIERVLDMCTDDLSKETLNAYMRFRAQRDIKPLLQVTRPIHKQYFDETVFTPPRENAVFVDMGVYDGSTSTQFIEWNGGMYKGIVLFEPDDVSFERSKKNLVHLKNIIFYHEGASDYCGTAYFKPNTSGGSRVSDKTTEHTISLSTLDSKLSEIPFHPTIIKMDIEGSECAALRGCAETIKLYKPALVICAYHKIEDVWDIPLLIKDLNPEYRIYFRHYSYSCSPLQKMVRCKFDLVCYAI